jgi:NAD(P)H-dependent flavin oxidoreductase YrpB (nitropropane dioxygenase family)
MKELIIGDLVAKVPIIQGGMAVGISLSGLASAVANAGGIGVIATAGIGHEEEDLNTNYVGVHNRVFTQEIRKARALSPKGIIGVNIMVALSNYAEFVKVAIDEEADIIFSGAGLPLSLPKYLPEGNKKTKLVPIVSSGRAATVIANKWITNYNYIPPAFVVEGPMAGGHLGFKKENIYDPEYALEKLLPDVLEHVRVLEKEYGVTIPVIPAGGIYTGEDIYKFIKMGAAGVQMATRFVATYECDASDEFKQSYLRAKKEDIVIIASPVGMPGRAIRNKFLVEVEAGQKKPFKCPFHCIITCRVKDAPYCIAEALCSAKAGRLSDGFAFAGENVYRVNEIVHVKDLVSSLASEYNKAEEMDKAGAKA